MRPTGILVEPALAAAGESLGLGGTRESCIPETPAITGSRCKAPRTSTSLTFSWSLAFPTWAIIRPSVSHRISRSPITWRGPPNVAGVPWDELSSTVDTNGYDLALGYVTDLADQGYVGLNFTAQTYPGVSKFTLSQILPAASVGFTFNVVAAATPLDTGGIPLPSKRRRPSTCARPSWPTRPRRRPSRCSPWMPRRGTTCT